MFKFVEVSIDCCTYPESEYEEYKKVVLLCHEHEVQSEIELIELDLEERSQEYGTTFAVGKVERKDLILGERLVNIINLN